MKPTNAIKTKTKFLQPGLAVVMSLLLILPWYECLAQGEGYTFGAADILTVAVFAGGEQQIAVDLTVCEQGDVNFPFIGSVKAAGLTASQLEKAVHGHLERDYFVDPQVHISVKEYHSLTYSISGAVRIPGKYEMKSTTTILDLIAKAEGVVSESGKIAYIMREGSQLRSEKSGNIAEPRRVNLKKLLDEGDMSHNVVLESGDSIYIPFSKMLNQADSKVYVSGKVEKPALYDHQPGLTALSVCLMAGGFAKSAAPNRTTIVRMENEEQIILKVDLDEVVKGRGVDMPLQPGDRIHVPESWF